MASLASRHLLTCTHNNDQRRALIASPHESVFRLPTLIAVEKRIPGLRQPGRQITCSPRSAERREESMLQNSEVKSLQASSATSKEAQMLYWAMVFLIVAIIAGVLGFVGVATAAAGFAKILFYIFLIVFLITLIMGLGRRGRTGIE